MKVISTIAIATSAFAISGCLPDLTESEFAKPSASGAFTQEFAESVNATTNDGSGNGYAYEIGVDSGDFFGTEYPVITVLAGVLPTTSLTSLPSSGQATFAGTYEAVAINLNNIDESMTAEEVKDAFYNTGAIILNADFNAGTLAGSGGDLTVNGTFTSDQLGGTVDYNGLSGELQGLIGGDGAVAVFQGDDLDEVLVGGFIVN